MVSFGYLVSTEFPGLRLRATRRWVAVAVAAWGAVASSCNDSTAGRLGPTDGGRLDGSQQSTDGAVQNVRPDGGPILPAADREVVLALGDAPTTLSYTVAATPAMLDVQLSIDTTGSFVEEIDALQSALAGTVIPSIRSIVPGSSFGLSLFQDFPAAPYGTDTDKPYLLVQRVTSDLSAISSAVKSLPTRIGNGGDIFESGYEALYQAASGEGLSIAGRTYVPRFSGSGSIGGGTVGGAGFRDDSFRVVVHATDAASHEPSDYLPNLPGTHDATDVVDAFLARDIRLVGITNGGIARTQLEELALLTGSYVTSVDGTCPTGVLGTARATTSGVCPLVFDVYADGTGLSTALVSAISNVVSGIHYGYVRGTVLDDRLGFVVAVNAASAIPPPLASPPARSDSTPGDGYDDTFTQVPAGTQMTFEVRLQNDLIASQTYEQTFRFHLRIEADSALLVDEWIRVVVPAVP